ncbi:Crp/Fnr family transcriptional regulator [Leptospira gomenensis]|uniref:Crp/Fnr family transcriptional regulator n=1 Tax=Leptospira gomenensis TaxID=2484974 RepID=A0A5F1YCL2_9LEPT|nr:Crp/Fnr family transcriptional regulator [Leptospira gomenensis]TGK33240.1 Crp/Fnr family transcriptional regulator [Leptospira gomenensis]TGK35528.1 Crp/Fnr family transcriptional regulator [Leptospira gomenensis]TGK40851.1 Crp/Fnr family transcriptional regulator [Leptospira gomenensis]TGK61142.1 Crp/Fnr family transcriptional regulator [Leptospira gomenensis]
MRTTKPILRSIRNKHWTEIQKKFRNEIALIGVRKKYKKTDRVYDAKDPYLGFFEVVSGIFKVYSLNSEGREIILKIFYPGEFIATQLLFQTEEPCFYPLFCEALHEGELIHFPKKEFKSFLLKNVDALFSFSALAIEHVSYFRGKVLENQLYSVKERILIFLTESGASDNFISLSITKQQLASLLGTTPESISRAFRILLEESVLLENENSYKIASTETAPIFKNRSA